MPFLSLSEQKVPFFHTWQESRRGWRGRLYSCLVIKEGGRGLVLKLSLHSRHTAFTSVQIYLGGGKVVGAGDSQSGPNSALCNLRKTTWGRRLCVMEACTRSSQIRMPRRPFSDPLENGSGKLRLHYFASQGDLPPGLYDSAFPFRHNLNAFCAQFLLQTQTSSTAVCFTDSAFEGSKAEVTQESFPIQIRAHSFLAYCLFLLNFYYTVDL